MVGVRALAASAALALVAACGGQAAAPGTTTASTTAATTLPATAAPSTTGVSPSSTAPSGDVRYRVGTPTLGPPDPLPGSDGASGSGCTTPGPGSLPDGVWFGTAVEIRSDSIVFDLACFFFGEIAYEKGEEDGVEEVTNDYYVRNLNPETRQVPVADTALVHTLGESTDDGFEELQWGSWPPPPPTYVQCPGCIVWLYVNDGRVTEIVEQFTP